MPLLNQREALYGLMELLMGDGANLADLFARFAERLQLLVPFDHAQLFAHETDRRFIRLVGEYPEAVLPLQPRTAIRINRSGMELLASIGDGVQYDPGRDTSGLPLPAEMNSAGFRTCWAAPLGAGDTIYGLVHIARRSPRRFTPDELPLLTAAARLLAISVRRESEVAAARQAVARSAILNELALLLNAGEPVEALTERMLTLLERAIAFDYAGLLVTGEEPCTLRQVVTRPAGFWPDGKVIRYEEVGFETLLEAGGPFNEYRVDRVPEGTKRFQEWGIARAASIVMRLNGQPLGMLSVGRRQNLAFNADDAAFLETVAGLLAEAVANQRRLEEIERAASRRHVLNEVALLVNAGHPADAFFAQFSTTLQQALPFDHLSLLVHDRDGRHLRAIGSLTAGADDPPATFELASMPLSASQAATSTGVLQARTEYYDQPSMRWCHERGIQRLASFVLHDASGAVGLLNVGRFKPDRMSDDEIGFIRVVGTLIARAIASQRRLERVEAEAARSDLLKELSFLLNAGEPAQTLFDRLPALLQRAVSFDYAGIAVVSATDDRLRASDWNLRTGVGVRDRWLTREELQWESLARMAEPVVQFRPQPRAGVLEGHFDEMGFRRSAVLLLSDPSGPVGLLHLARIDSGRFSRDEMTFLEVVATLLAQSVGNQLRIERTAAEAKEQRLLAKVAAAAAKESDAASLLAALAEILQPLVPRPLVAYAHVEQDQAVYGQTQGERAWPLLPLQRRAIAQGQAVHLEADGPYPAGHPMAEAAPRSAVVSVTYTAGAAAGLLTIASRDASFIPAERHLRTFHLVAQTVGPAMESLRASAAVARQTVLYSMMFNSLSEGVILLDRDMRPALANEPAERIISLFNPDREPVTVPEVVQLMHPIARESMLRSILHGEPGRFRIPLNLAGEHRWMDFELIPLADPQYRLLAVASDVTDAVRVEEEERRHREEMDRAARLVALGELIGGVAHELNNPLTAVLGFSELLTRTHGAGPIGEELGIIQKEALRARNIVRDLLLIARPGQKERTRVRVADVVAHIERLRRSVWQQQGIEVVIEAADAGCEVWGNETQVTQTLLNLLTNAEDAIRTASTKQIKVRYGREGDNATVIEVTDTGHGMDEQTALRIFEPFFTTKQGRGTGLGLSLSHSIVRAHDGAIEVSSRPGEGATFRVRLPQPPREPDAIAAAPGAPGRCSRVLVIDDEPSLRDVCQRLVTSMGHDCAVAQDSGEALALATTNEYDLLLCDYRLAGETADRVIEALSNQVPHVIDRIVIATGAASDPGVVELTERYGLRLIAKPYGSEEIARLIERSGRAS